MCLCRVTRKEKAGVLYSRIRLCIHIGELRYVRLLFPYPSAAHSITLSLYLFHSEMFKGIPFPVNNNCYTHVTYSLINCDSHDSCSLVNVPKFP